MESITYVAEATALIEGIHVLKRWIYDGTAQLLIPICTITAVEDAYKLSITPKDPPKQQTNRHSGRPTRKEQPLFDINPRTAWEFLSRAKSEKGIVGVTFQQENEVFTQWKKEEDERAAKAETPLLPPSSFADALLRKLNTTEQKESTKVPSKPKLTARTKETKPIWKIEKVPEVSSEGLTESDKSLLSCMLWRTYEAERNPLQPVRYILLAHSSEIKDKAVAFGLLNSTVPQIQEQLAKERKKHDTRSEHGELEQKFPEVLAMSQALGPGSPDRLDTGPADFGFLEAQDTKSEAFDSFETPSNLEPKIEAPAARNPPIEPEIDGLIIPNTTQDQTMQKSAATVDIKGDSATITSNASPLASPLPSPSKTRSVDPTFGDTSQGDQPPIVSETNLFSSIEHKNVTNSESELESDEEIIVFNPRNKRTSGIVGTSSRPGSAGGFVQKTYKAGVQTNSRPSSSKGLISLDGQIEMLLKPNDENTMDRDLNHNGGRPETPDNESEYGLKTPLESKLKAQSPVFTPGQPFIPSPLGISASTGTLHYSGNAVEGVVPPAGPRQANPRARSGQMAPRDHGQELLRIQKENSQRIIQRQRDAIQRQTRTTEANVKSTESSSPRLVQMEPTDNPTIIDPDAYDRSYVVQAPSKTVAHHSGDKQRSRSSRHKPKEHSKKISDPSTKHNGHAIEPEVDFVLKSGSPRGSTRGRGKLWVP